jgi:hypothetical protein
MATADQPGDKPLTTRAMYAQAQVSDRGLPILLCSDHMVLVFQATHKCRKRQYFALLHQKHSVFLPSLVVVCLFTFLQEAEMLGVVSAAACVHVVALSCFCFLTILGCCCCLLLLLPAAACYRLMQRLLTPDTCILAETGGRLMNAVRASKTAA